MGTEYQAQDVVLKYPLAKKSSARAVAMAKTTDPQTDLRTVPLHLDQSHRPRGSYSQMMGRLGVRLSAHCVRRFNRPLFQPGFEGSPFPSKIRFEVSLNAVGDNVVVQQEEVER